jgi:hypothetical protein
MKQLVLVGALITAVAAGASAQTPAATLGTVTLSKKLMADGKPLAPGTYQVRLSTDEVKPPATGQDPNSEKWVEFVKGGKVAGREVATVISAQDVGAIVKGKKPAANGASVEMLKGGDYWRVWINKGGTNYIINLPPGT